MSTSVERSMISPMRGADHEASRERQEEYDGMEKAKADREFEIMVWGASGFTGKLTAEYLLSRYDANGSLRWALVSHSGSSRSTSPSPSLSSPSSQASRMQIASTCCSMSHSTYFTP